jgi:hypothetical protein
MVNFMPRPQGGFRKRPGSLFIGHTYGPDAAAQITAIKSGRVTSAIAVAAQVALQVVEAAQPKRRKRRAPAPLPPPEPAPSVPSVPGWMIALGAVGVVGAVAVAFSGRR